MLDGKKIKNKMVQKIDNIKMSIDLDIIDKFCPNCKKRKKYSKTKRICCSDCNIPLV